MIYKFVKIATGETVQQWDYLPHAISFSVGAKLYQIIAPAVGQIYYGHVLQEVAG